MCLFIAPQIEQRLKEQQEHNKFIEEVISPFADKIIGEITSSKLSYRQATELLDLIKERIKDITLVL
jgi:hypothetical protein